MPDTAATQFVAMKFGLAMAIGDSLDLATMARRFMVPLLQAVRGAGCQLWLHDEPGVEPEVFAYPLRSLQDWRADARRHAWMRTVAAAPPGPLQQFVDGDAHLYALPVGDVGWLFVERRSASIEDAVLQAITVVLVRLGSACRACRQHAQARRLLAEKDLAEQALQEVNARMAEIFSLSADGFANFDAEGRLAFANPQAGVLLGLAPVPGLTLTEIDRRLHGRTASPIALDAAARTLDTHASATGMLEFTEPVPLIVAWTLRRAAGEAHTVLHLRDVTRESEVDRLKSEFLATAAHELRTPMVSVYGFTELLLTRDIDGTRQRHMLETMHRQSSLLIDLINQLLDLARIEARRGLSVERRRMRLGDLVSAAVDGLVVPAGRDPVAVTIHDPDCPLEVDTARFHRALLNVLSNAYKYSPGGGPVTLSTAATVENNRQGVAVRVTDCGIGMSPAQVARIFERFWRADDSGHIPGSGLGMSLVKEIADLHGGHVTVASALGVGTTLTTWWPLSDAPASTASTRTTAPDDTSPTPAA
jgi:signal transduction histidine kinase